MVAVCESNVFCSFFFIVVFALFFNWDDCKEGLVLSIVVADPGVFKDDMPLL